MTPSLPDGGSAPRGPEEGAAPSSAGATSLPLLPTRELVVFPGMVTSLLVGRDKFVRAVENAYETKTGLVLSVQRKPGIDDPQPGDIMAVGTRVAVLQLLRLPDGSVRALVDGQERVRIERFELTSPYFVVAAVSLVSPDGTALRSRSLARRVMAEFAAYAQLNPQAPDEIEHFIARIAEPERMGDVVAAHLQIPAAEKQALLESASTHERLASLLEILKEENAALRLEQEIGERVQRRIEGAERQLLLHEKLRVIREEIEESGGSADEEFSEYTRQLAEGGLSPAAERLARRELGKLRQTSPMSPEVAVIRGYLDTLLSLPWGRLAPADVDVAAVARHLERTHYGLTEVKDRILEHLAVCRMLAGAGAKAGRGGSRAARADQPTTILCLAGPPGTGKSSVAESIAGALGRPFVRVALGGVRDEAEIRGHRRTYVGAMPGRIVEGLAKAGVDNPIILLDELDKLDQDWRGNPASALMEVLDPAHNASFRDNYLECEYDLSRVFFVATANDVDGIPASLYDRLEVIHLSGYMPAEKLAIARRHLIPRTAADSGMRRGDMSYGRGALHGIIRGYTREAGVRELERALRRIARKVARRHLESGEPLPVAVGKDDLRGYLGEALWLEDALPTAARVGQAYGLAYTTDGGEVLTIEAALAKGRGELVLTGQLGDVMQESAAAAWGYLLASVERDRDLRALIGRSPHLTKDGLDVANQDVRVHVPEGAVPKDGPSAGLALAVAMLSALGAIPVRARVAMTGEITLGGRILRVGGLREKLLAAARSGVRTVVLPSANRATVAELPVDLVEKLDLVYVGSFTEALPHVLVSRRPAVRRPGRVSR